MYDPHPPFNPPQRYRDMFDPATMPGPQFVPEDLAAQQQLANVDFQSRAMHPDRLDIAHPILPKTLKPGEGDPAGESPGARDAKSLQAAYYAMIKLIDDQLARILDALDASGQRENTVIIFMSDHGETLGDHGLIQKGCRFYEGLVRVPLIISSPSRFNTGIRSDELVALMDVAPTLLEIAGLPVPEYMQGKSLRTFLSRERLPTDHRNFVRCEYYDALDLADGSLATMYREDNWKIVHYHEHEFGELFDLNVDPWEHENLWEQEEFSAERARLTQASFNATMAAIDRGPPRIGPY